MKPDKIHDALNYIDDELIEAADKVRSAPSAVRKNHSRTIALVATLFMMLAATLVFVKFIAPGVTSDSAVDAGLPLFTDTANKGAEFVDGMIQSDDAVTDLTAKFSPDSFVAGIPTPPIERFAFYHKIFTTSTYLFLYMDAHYWPEELMDADIQYDRSSIKVYYYDPNNSDNGIGTITLAFPDDFDTAYDHVTPIYATGGGGSGECEIVFYLDYGEKSVFVAFNNFRWASSIFDFEYAGIVSEADVRSNLQTAPSKATTSRS